MDKQPALFVSHGAPTLPLEPGSDARDFLAALGVRLGRPRAIIALSAHWEAQHPRVGAALRPRTVHDFSGFPQRLYEMQYPVAGAPDVAIAATELLSDAGYEAEMDADRGMDHGVWIPLMLMFPNADIPVVQISLLRGKDASAHVRLGQALAPLRGEGCLLVASGGLVHNLGRLDPTAAEPPGWAHEFERWLLERVSQGDLARVAEYRRQAPHAVEAHPTDEHLMPLFVAWGAADGAPGRVLHRSFSYGSISMATVAFGEGARFD